MRDIEVYTGTKLVNKAKFIQWINNEYSDTFAMVEVEGGFVRYFSIDIYDFKFVS